MPTYDYICDACGHHWELFQKISDDPVKKCPECGKKKAVRQFGTGAAIMFKGSGFYETDYRSDSYKKSAEADKPKKSDSKDGSSKSEGSSTKSESKTSDSGSKSSKKKKD
ncbi:MAG: zinc ribbon domain-containing protein [Planctomycetota bacterium]